MRVSQYYKLIGAINVIIYDTFLWGGCNRARRTHSWVCLRLSMYSDTRKTVNYSRVS